MLRLILALTSTSAVLAAGVAVVADQFDFLQPTVTVSANDRRLLDRGDPIARVVPARDRQVAIFAATSTRMDADRLVAWTREIAQLKKSRYVETTRRFSDPPRIEDLADLLLDDDDLADVQRCRRGRCALKLAGHEIDEFRRIVESAGTGWKAALQTAFRRLVLRRVEAYLAGGHPALAPFEDAEHPTRLDDAFSRLVGQSHFLGRSLPAFSDYLERFPNARMEGVESFVYWSKERLARKALVSATHVAILRHEGGVLPDVIIAGKGIFATRYLNASMGVTALVQAEGGRAYLTYLNRSEADALSGFFGGLVRLVVERRLKAEADDVLEGVRKRLESGSPPTSSVTAHDAGGARTFRRAQSAR